MGGELKKPLRAFTSSDLRKKINEAIEIHCPPTHIGTVDTSTERSTLIFYHINHYKALRFSFSLRL